ncbi:MAG: hemerythrin domain-containing protein [Wenzhouxiangella sp.]|jgi:hemerythrin-like domain-containing protein|nr:hemerythrin domain-containing protein [Wenzhouxiangella sp.]
MSAKPKKSAPGSEFMRTLRRDHAGLSRVLRELEVQAARLVQVPEQAAPVLADALSYLLRYHHAFHHPREDRLFARIRAQDKGLDTPLAELSHDHEVGEEQLSDLVDLLNALNDRQLRGKSGQELADRIQEYVRHTRVHMRDEEAVFYARAEGVLDGRDWREVIAADDGRKDPMTDLVEMSSRYPRLAEQLGLPVQQLGLIERASPVSEALREQMLSLIDLYGGLAYDMLDLGRGHIDRLLSVRGPVSLAKAMGEMSSANLKFVGRCLTRPPRWAINSAASVLVASLRPYLRERQR